MTVYRTGYGTGAYSAYSYGLDGSIVDAAAAISAATTTTAAGQRVKDGVSALSVVSTTTTSAVRVRQSASAISAAVSLTAALRRRQSRRCGAVDQHVADCGRSAYPAISRRDFYCCEPDCGRYGSAPERQFGFRRNFCRCHGDRRLSG